MLEPGVSKPKANICNQEMCMSALSFLGDSQKVGKGKNYVANSNFWFMW